MTGRVPALAPRAAALLALAAFVAFAPPARAGEPLPAEVRRRAEADFVWGRLDRLDATLGASTSPVDLEALAVRDLYWRPRPNALAAIPAAAFDGSLSGRRLAWLADWARRPEAPRDDYPMPGAGETDAWPRMTAIVRDRLEREREGVALPEVGRRLVETKDPDLEYFVGEYLGARTGMPARVAPETPAKPVLRPATPPNLGFAIAAVAGLLALGAGLWWGAVRAARGAVGVPAKEAGVGPPRP